MARSVAAGVVLLCVAGAGLWGFGVLNAASPGLPGRPALRVQPHAAAIASQPENAAAQGRADVLRLLFARDFETLTRAIETRQAEVEKDIRREGELARLTLAFDTADPAITPLLDAWVEAHPASFAPWVSRAQHRVAVAWARRGTRWASETTEGQFRGMTDSLRGVVDDAQKALSKNPKVIEAHRLLIRAVMAYGRTDVCAAAAARGIQQMPASMRIRVALAHCLLPRWGGSYELLDALAAEAEAHVGTNPALAALGGFADWDRGRLEQSDSMALALYTSALARGEHSSFYFDRARLHLAARRYAEALADMDRALVLAPEDPEMLVRRAMAHAGLLNTAAAADDIRLAALIDPPNPTLAQFRERELKAAPHDAYQLLRAGDHRGAFARFATAIALTGGSAEVHYWRGRAYLEVNDPQNALAAFEAALKLDPRHFEACRSIDYILAKRGEWDEVIRRWTVFLALERANGRAYFERAGARRHKGDLDAALADARKACDLGVTDACAVLRRPTSSGGSSPS